MNTNFKIKACSLLCSVLFIAGANAQTGNVGIGTNTPASLLSVGTLPDPVNSPLQINHSGDIIKIKNIPYAWPNQQAAGDCYVLTNNGLGGLSWAAPKLVCNSNILSDPIDLPFWGRFSPVVPGPNLSDHQFFGYAVNSGTLRYHVDQPGSDHAFFAGVSTTASTELMRIKGNGNVGIGAPEPGERLTVANSDNAQATNIANFLANNLTQGIAFGYDEIRKSGSNANGDIKINAKGSGNLILQNTATGNVGIGTPQPSAPLDVFKAVVDGTTVTGIRVSESSGQASGRNTFEFYNGNQNYTKARLWSEVGSSYAATKFGIDVADAARTIQTRMVIDVSGNVGIGTSNPDATAKLDVAGTTKMTGFKMTTGATDGHVLVSDAFGNALWKPQPWLQNGSNLYSLNSLCIGTNQATNNNTSLTVLRSGVANYNTNNFGATIYNQQTYPSGTGGYKYGLNVASTGTYGGINIGLAVDVSGSTVNNGNIAATFYGGGVGIGIFPTGGSRVLNVNGNAEKTGGGMWEVYSDARVKKDISAYTDGLAVVRQINPVKYKYNGLAKINDTSKEYIGVLAQDIQKVVPYTVESMDIELTEDEIPLYPTGSTKFKRKEMKSIAVKNGLSSSESKEVNVYGADILSFDPNAIIYLLVNSVKELDKKNTELTAEIEKLKNQINKTGK